ncbi:biopolymer transport protein TolQ [Bradyrhizobium betae]|nr:biopolymer transport protein TolQ [Bradyrhizobium betae]
MRTIAPKAAVKAHSFDILAGNADGRLWTSPCTPEKQGFERACRPRRYLARLLGNRRHSLLRNIGNDRLERILLMNPAEMAQSALPVAASADVSLIALFWQAHWIVKGVMLGLLGCSVWVWAIAIDKIFLFARTRRSMDRFEQAFWSGESIEELYRTLSAKPTHSMAACFVAAMREWKRSFENQARSVAGLQMRIDKVMNVSIAREVERLERRLLVLATVGSAGPFVGLFGTVWGIMSSFQSIAASKNTSLAVVAPGIAEALFATAVGLIAAIPATIFYNKFTSEVNRQAQRLEGFADEFSAILSRQIDERG